MVKEHWIWESTDPDRSGSSGDLAKLFRHEEPKRPGILAKDAPLASATLLAREVIQNSWDAARELRRDELSAPQFMIEFRFEELKGDGKSKLVESLDLGGLSQRLASVEQGRKHLGLLPEDCLSELAEADRPLRILRIVERATTGMYGPWAHAQSRMYWALVSLGYTVKAAGAGGSYGYGKAGLISGSKIRTVCAYTCFRERQEEPGVTRRLLGMTYWGQHDSGKRNYTGFARFGHQFETTEPSVRPFENEEADEVAKALGIELRTPAQLDDLGTTFMVIDPTVAPDDLLRAIERNWWPALAENDFMVSVYDYEGNECAPRPKRDSVLKSFIDTWEIANERSSHVRDREASDVLTLSRSISPDELVKGRFLGRLALTSDLEDWSYADQRGIDETEVINHKSLVALVRGPRMVVEYLECGQAPPYVRGVFIADSDVGERVRSIDDYLRQTEPKAHDSWRSRDSDGELDPGAAAVAADIAKQTRRKVDALRKQLKPALPKADDVRLPVFNDLMRRMLRGDSSGVPAPTAEVKEILISPVFDLEEAGHGLIRVSGHVTFTLTEHSGQGEGAADLFVGYRFLEDDRVGEFTEMTYDLSGARGFKATAAGCFTGTLKRNDPVRIAFVTEPYALDWTGRLVVEGKLAEPAGIAGGQP